MRDLRHVAVHQLPVEDDPFARDHHVADEARAEPEDPVAGDARRVEWCGRVVVEDDEVGRRAGTQRPEQRLVEDLPREPCAVGEARERPGRGRAAVVLAQPEVRRPRLLEHVGADPVGAERQPPVVARDVRPADGVVHVRAGVVRQPGTGPGDECGLVLVEVDAVREQRALVEPVVGREPLHGVDVDRVLRRVHMEADAELGCDLDAGAQRLVRERERRVRADEAAGERQVALAEARQEAAVLGEAGAGDRGAVAVRRLVAEDAAEPEPVERVGDHVERSVDGVRRGVVIDHGRRAGEERLHAADERRRAHSVQVERPIEAPPDPLEDLEEVLRRFEPVRHAAGERRIEMRVRADVARDDHATGAVACFARARCVRRDPPLVDRERPERHRRRVERLDDGRAGERDRHAVTCSRWPTRWGTAARAAGESFIGSSVRRIPSNA